MGRVALRGRTGFAALATMPRSFSKQSATLRPASRNRWLTISRSPSAVIRRPRCSSSRLRTGFRQARAGHHRPAEQGLGVQLIYVLSARSAAAGKGKPKLPERYLDLRRDDKHGFTTRHSFGRMNVNVFGGWGLGTRGWWPYQKANNMTKSKGGGRKTQRIVRMPATKSAHLRKRMQQRKYTGTNVRKYGGG